MSVLPAILERMTLQQRLADALRDRTAGPEAAVRAQAIWDAPGPRRFTDEDPICRVHSHAGMFPGGIRALLLQSLHPLAMAGVGEHSGYRGDPWGRLHRTSEFIAMTTFGPVPEADAIVARIDRAHGTVRGTAPDGRTYDARDPDLLLWVHSAEVDSFLAGHQRHARTPLTPDEADTYVAQAAWTGEALGAHGVPHSVAELRAVLARFRPDLGATEGALDAARFLLREPPLPWAARPGYWSLAASGVSLLPPWARDLLGIRLSRGADALVARPLGALGTGLVGWALAAPRYPGDTGRSRGAAAAAPVP